MATIEELDTRLAELEVTINGAVSVHGLPEKYVPDPTDSIEIQSAGGASHRVTLERIKNHNTSFITAGVSVTKGRIVTVANGLLADKDDIDVSKHLLGIALESGAAGVIIEILYLGIMYDIDWNWNTSATMPIFLANNGELTQIPPTTGTSWVLAKASDTKNIFFRPKEPLVLA